MYIVLEAGGFLYPLLGLYARLDVAEAFCAQALSEEKSQNKTFLVYSVEVEKTILTQYQRSEVFVKDSVITIGRYLDGMLQYNEPYVFKDL